QLLGERAARVAREKIADLLGTRRGQPQEQLPVLDVGPEHVSLELRRRGREPCAVARLESVAGGEQSGVLRIDLRRAGESGRRKQHQSQRKPQCWFQIALSRPRIT